jgi:oligosaccharyltransferase complex subunit beta
MTPKHLILSVILALVVLIGITTASIHTKPNPKTLIYYIQPDFKAQYSTFIASLEDKGHVISYTNPIDETVSLKNFDRLLYDNIFVFVSHASNALAGFPGAADFLDFVQSGGSLFLAPSDGVLSGTLRDVGLAYGVEYLPANSVVMDTQNPSTTLFTLALPNTTSLILGSNPSMSSQNTINTVGLGMSIVDNIPYVKKVLTGNPNMVIFDPVSHQVYESGTNISFLTALQLKNNARMTFFSDIALLSNAFLGSGVGDKNRNDLYLNAVCWVTHDCGFARLKTFNHHLFAPADDASVKNGFINPHKQILSNPPHPSKFTTINPPSYKVGDNVHFDIVLEQYNPYTKIWEPTTSLDVVFDMTMMHSFIRFPIEPTSTATIQARSNSLINTAFSTGTEQDRQANLAVEVSVPDTMGVYRTSVSTRDAFPSEFGSGISFLSLQEEPLHLPIRPYEHNEWARFLFAAYPYYLTMLVVMASFFTFSVAFMYTK